MCSHQHVATIESRKVDEHGFAAPGNMGTGVHDVIRQRRSIRYRRIFAALILGAAFILNPINAIAGTTGGLTGSVVDESGKPVANAAVTASSPSQTVTRNTDARGNFAFLSLAPDTYTVSVDNSGYTPVSLGGVSVFADNTQTIALRTTTALKTIASVTSRAAGNLVKPGTTSDVYSVNAATQNAVRGLGGGGSLNSAYSGIASVPGVFVPQGQNGWAQSVYVRGSNYTQIGYEYDGVPVQRSFDSYPAATLSALGQQELQVYTGAAPSNAQSQSIGGFINQVIRTGTYPGYGSGTVDIGTPTFYHKALVEIGGSIPSRLFSYYLGVAGYNQDFRYADQYNGAYLDPTYGTGYNFIQSGCNLPAGTYGPHPSLGCYSNAAGIFSAFPLGPYGEAVGPLAYGITSQIADREVVANFHVGIAHHKDGGRDDIQLLYNNSYLQTQYPVAMNDWTYAANNVINGTATFNGVNYPNCANVAAGTPCALLGPAQQSYSDRTVFTGPVGAVLTPAMVGQTAAYYQPESPKNRPFDAPAPPGERDYYQNDASIVKVQYQKNMGSNAYARIFGYTFYSDWLQNSLSGATITDNLAGVVSPNYSVITHTYGVVGQFADQINPQNLITLSSGYYQANTIRFNNEFYLTPPASTVAVAVDSTNPLDGICYGISPTTSAFSPLPCNSSGVWQYRTAPAVPGTTTVGPLAPKASNGSPDISTIGTNTCGGGPCEYYTVGSGYLGPYNNVVPKFTNVALEDNLHLGDRVVLNLGVHYDNFLYGLGDTSVAPGIVQPGAGARTLYANSFTTWYCYTPGTSLPVASATPHSCPAGSNPVTWSNTGPSSNDYHAFEPRLGATFTVNQLNVIRASYGKYLQPANTAYQQYQNTNYDLPLASPNNIFYQFGFTNPVHQVRPEVSYNADLSWEHQVKGTDITWKITPYQRVTDDAIFTVLLDPKTNFVSGLNVGRENAQGVEFQFQKGDFSRNGLAMLFNYTYTHETVKFGALPSGNTVVDGTNFQIAQYNSYTKFCAANPTDARCSFKGATVLPTNGAPAAPCYAGTTADPTCTAAGTVANPYWNAPPQALFNAGDEFVPYNQLPGATSSSTFVGSSFVVPHVASIVLNYKFNKWAVTPMVQFSGGGKYGVPTSGNGIDPAGGCLPLAGATLAGDPRYPFGAPGGAPYNAATCPGSLVTPDFVTGNYDGFGAFTEPDQISTSLGLTYNVSPRITLTALASNLFVNCFGGSNVPWRVSGKVGCWYTNAVGLYPGNFYNPGDTLQSGLANPYVPSIGNVFQSAYGGQVNPVNLYFTATIRI